jgi:hypothetical protein
LLLSKLIKHFNNPNAIILTDTFTYEDADTYKTWLMKNQNFIESIEPGICPYCYSSKTKTQGNGFACLECGETWSQSDVNLAKGMQGDSDKVEAAIFRKNKGSEDIDFE